MKKFFTVLLILTIPATICMLMHGMVSMDYWLFNGQMIANELAGKVSNGFVAAIYLYSSVFFLVTWFFIMYLTMNWDTLKKTQKEVDALRQYYRNKDTELDKLICQYRRMILNDDAKAKITDFVNNEDNHTEGELGNSCIDVKTLILFIKTIQP